MDTLRAKLQFWSLIILLLLFLGFSIYTFVYFKTECSHSKENPFVYAAQRANSSSCSCDLSNGDTLIFNKEKAWVPKTIQPNEIYNIDYSFNNYKEVD